eukprot:CAMPEP_0119120200 /NCGR_PEP_ID=MMETSP1310-20130426/1347_1 /TAXON_ID=464262 /ORGANISM="Genus nov. species nov., Strain RCC2339" /LENGTH=73 /DNA_ID=CAMNT_0007109667 /DNA_START=120 /DNA_END=341 /DNA_ORIENTATION=+
MPSYTGVPFYTFAVREFANYAPFMVSMAGFVFVCGRFSFGLTEEQQKESKYVLRAKMWNERIAQHKQLLKEGQ